MKQSIIKSLVLSRYFYKTSAVAPHCHEAWIHIEHAGGKKPNQIWTDSVNRAI